MTFSSRGFSAIDLFHNNKRRILIIGAFLCACIGALGLAGLGAPTDQVWAVIHDIQPGSRITEGDLAKVSVNLSGSHARYLDSSGHFSPMYTTRALGAGELLPRAAITSQAHRTPTRDIPLGIQASDIPANLQVGDLVDLYLVPRDTAAQSEKVSAHLRVADIDLRSRNIGGSINLILSANESEVIYITDALALGRIVVVRIAN